MDKAKPFDIPKREVWEAYKRVKAGVVVCSVITTPVELFGLVRLLQVLGAPDAR